MMIYEGESRSRWDAILPGVTPSEWLNCFGAKAPAAMVHYINAKFQDYNGVTEARETLGFMLAMLVTDPIAHVRGW